MAAGNQQVTITFAGNASGLQQAATQVQQSLTHVKDSAKDMGAATVAQGALMADIFKKIGTEALSFAKDALNAFRDTASEVRKMTRTIGGSVEEMSRLRFAAHEVGVSADTLVKSFGLASAHFAKNDDAVKRFGISMTDASGAVRPYTDVLGEISDKLNAMENPYEKAAAARALFGRGYQEMLPLLGLGSERMKEFGDEAEELGLVMSGSDLAAARNYNLAMKHLHATFDGIWVGLGRKLLPVMQWFVDTVSNAVQWVRHLVNENAAVASVLSVVGPALAAVAAAGVVVIGVIKTWTVVQKILDVVLGDSPIGLVIILVVGLIAAFIALVKNFEPVGDAIIAIGAALGWAIGNGINIATKAINFLINGFSSLVDAGLATVGFFASLADSVAGFFGFDTGLEDKVNSVRNSMKKLVTIVTDGLGNFGESAAANGMNIGANIAAGIVNAIKKLKMPTIEVPTAKEAPTPFLPEVGFDEAGGGGGGGGGGKAKGKSALQKKKDNILQFFTDLINSSREALNAIREAANNAREEMQQIGRDVGKAFSDAFSITDLTTKSFAEYLGGDALVAFYKQRLDAMGAFVTNIKKLITMGLPKEMLADIVNAGVEGGAKAAAMLVANPGIMEELRRLQAEINSQTSAAGEAVGTYLKGDEVARLTAEAEAARKTFAGYVTTANKIGYKTTDADRTAANTPITVNINATTNASPEAIAQAVSWALATGTALGMKPAA